MLLSSVGRVRPVSPTPLTDSILIGPVPPPLPPISPLTDFTPAPSRFDLSTTSPPSPNSSILPFTSPHLDVPPSSDTLYAPSAQVTSATLSPDTRNETLSTTLHLSVLPQDQDASPSPDPLLGSEEDSPLINSCSAEPSQSTPIVHAHPACGEADSVFFHDLPFQFLTRDSLLRILSSHRVKRGRSSRTADVFRTLALEHRCSPLCRDSKFVLRHEFKVNSSSTTGDDVKSKLRSLLRKNVVSRFPTHLTPDKREKLISDWIDHFSNQSMNMVVCSVCSEKLLESQTKRSTLSDSQLDLLNNPALPAHLRPDDSRLARFRGAILNPLGFVPHEDAPDLMNICLSCLSHLDNGNLPPLSLANGNYLARDRVPPHILALFDNASAVELSLISRYRVRCTVHKFSSKGGSAQAGSNPLLSQKYLHGNTITFANQCSDLLDILPPTPDALSESICVMFTGSVYPSPDDLKKFTPVLARRHVVVTLLTWLKENNPFYQDVTISTRNLDDLLPSDEPSIPNGVTIRHLPSSSSAESSGYTNYGTLSESAPSIPMASHGVIAKSLDGLSTREIKLAALQHWNSNGGAYTIPHSKDPINEYDNPSLFPCMFPHLFPFGIGGFEDRERRVKVTLVSHIKHMLNLSDTRFQTDNCCAFVAMNILQRRKAWESTKFKTSRKSYRKTAELLSSVEASTCRRLMERASENRGYVFPVDDDEKKAFDLLDRVQVVAGDVPGSSASKVRLRNSIRSLMHWCGSPTFFITINPADVYSPLFCHIAGFPVDLDVSEPTLPSDFERRLYLAKNPAAGARFFHAIMRSFFDILISPPDDPSRGIFGNVEAYFGSIEAQGRGSLHCHMLIWVSGSPGPEQLRQRLESSSEDRDDIFNYLEETISNSSPGTRDVVSLQDADFPRRPSHLSHPCSRRCLDPRSTKDFESMSLEDLKDLIIECNYHIHSETCWKNLKPTDPRDDAHCRMRIDGHTRGMTVLDPETGSILLRRLHPFINNYNELIIMLCRCNMDIKHIGSGKGAKALIYYITDYITKTSLPTSVAFSAMESILTSMKDPAFNLTNTSGMSNEERRGQATLIKICNALVGNQELSGQQVMMNLLGLADGDGDHYTSHSFVTLHWASFSAWIRDHEQQRSDALTLSEDLATNADVNVNVLQTMNDDLPSDTLQDMTTITPDDLGDLVDQADNESTELGAASDDDDAGETQLSPGPTDNNLGDTDESDENNGDEVVVDLGRRDLVPQSQLMDYLYRGQAFNDIPLYWFVASTLKKTKTSDSARVQKTTADGRSSNAGRRPNPRADFLPGHPQHGTHFLRMKDVLEVPKILGPSIPKRNHDNASYCRTMLALFRPWRQLDDLLPAGESWCESFSKYVFDDDSQRIMNNMNHLHECKDARDEYSDLRRRGVITSNLIDENLLTKGVTSSQLLDSGDTDVAPDASSTVHPDDSDARLAALRAFSETKKLALAQLAVAAAKLQGAFACPTPPELGGNPMLIDSSRPVSERETKILSSDLRALKSLQSALEKQRFANDDVQRTQNPPTRPLNNAFVNSHVIAAAQLRDEGIVHAADLGVRLPASTAAIVAELKAQYSLNENQERALQLVADTLDVEPATPLTLFLSGPGGTGKTRVVDAISELFRRKSVGRLLMKAAPTGVAARQIGGSTVRSLLNIGRKIGALKREKMQNLWKPATHLLLEEASMCGAELLSKISERIGQLRESTALPFGGMHVIFSGDICQMPPVADSRLWKVSDKSIAGVIAAGPKKKGQRVAHGVGLWRQINKVVLLTENHRAGNDPLYADMMERIREGHGRGSDSDLLRTRLIEKGNVDPSLLVDAPLVTTDKILRDEWNDAAVSAFAQRTNQQVFEYHSLDYSGGTRISPTMQSTLWNLPCCTTGSDRLGKLKLVKGMRVMVLSNILTEMGVVNGAEGTLHDIVYDEIDGVRVAKVAYVHIAGCGTSLPGLPHDVVPIFPENESIRLRTRRQKTLTFKRTQLPLMPAYAFTDFKCQGRTMQFVVVDLHSVSRNPESAYVMLSRAVGLNNIAILRDFDFSKINHALPYDTALELDRLKKMDAQTKTDWMKRHNAPDTLPVTVP